jgi:dTDP-D-glucose 4,6-dehydratase
MGNRSRLLTTGGAGFIGRNPISPAEGKYDESLSSVAVINSLTHAEKNKVFFRVKTPRIFSF